MKKQTMYRAAITIWILSSLIISSMLGVEVGSALWWMLFVTLESERWGTFLHEKYQYENLVVSQYGFSRMFKASFWKYIYALGCISFLITMFLFREMITVEIFLFNLFSVFVVSLLSRSQAKDKSREMQEWIIRAFGEIEKTFDEAGTEEVVEYMKEHFGEEVSLYAKKFLESNRITEKTARKTAYPVLYKTFPKKEATLFFFPDFKNYVMCTPTCDMEELKEDVRINLRELIEMEKETGHLPFAARMDSVIVEEGEGIMLVTHAFMEELKEYEQSECES